jgi:hypothetical protein
MIFPFLAGHSYIIEKNLDVIDMKQDLEKMAVAARCTNPHCKFNGVVLIAREKSKEASLKKEECPVCHVLGCLKLILL